KASFSSFSHRALVASSDLAVTVAGTARRAAMKRLIITVTAIVLAGLSLGVVMAAETVELVSIWNPPGALPDGCTPALTRGGGPRARPGGAAPTRGGNGARHPDGARGASETSGDPTDYRFPLCIVEGPRSGSPGTFDVSVRFRATAGKVDQAAGLAVRLKDAR